MNPAHLDEVNQIVEAALQAGLSLRLTGSWAVYFHCPEHRTLMAAFGRTYRDADFVAYTRDNKRVSSLMAASGYKVNSLASACPGWRADQMVQACGRG